MSRTVAHLVDGVRVRLRCPPGSGLIDSREIPMALSDALQELAADGIVAKTIASNYVTTVAGTGDYTLTNSGTPSAEEHEGIDMFRRSSDRVELIRKSPSWILEQRQNAVSLRGLPEFFALYEDTASSKQAVKLMLYPTPGSAHTGTLDAMFSLIPDRLYYQTGDTATVQMSRLGLAALESLAASRVAAAMSPDTLQKLHLSPTFSQVLANQGLTLKQAEMRRIYGLQLQDGIELREA